MAFGGATDFAVLAAAGVMFPTTSSLFNRMMARLLAGFFLPGQSSPPAAALALAAEPSSPS